MSAAAPLSVVPIVLADVSGTRLWPLSRSHHPKQYPALGVGKAKQTLLQQAPWRTAQLADVTIVVQRPCVVAKEKHSFTVVEQLRDIDAEAERIVVEPLGRITAPKRAMRRAVVFDGRNILDTRLSRGVGFEYTGNGRP
jgi:mannose-1-phosphate guanylyltransferase